MATTRQSALTDEFGGRKLDDESKVYDFNAWDNVEWDEEQKIKALEIVGKQETNPVPEDQRQMYNDDAAGFWDKFYSVHTNSFFKDRHWLRQEFPELFSKVEEEKRHIFEIGCGAGNTVFPLLSEDVDKKLFVYAADFSKTAVDVVKSNPEYDETRCKAFVFDITSPAPPEEIPPESLDICICIFVLSALHPSAWTNAAQNIFKLLKPGGLCVFRDYGRYDLTQLRFKGGRLLESNFYIRGDGTQVYFFTQNDVNTIFSDFEILQNVEDRRLCIEFGYKESLENQ
ncbi:Methyltransferase-like protein 2-A [Phlyctochytrium planicorne]|nr:Methyltransferase-like protein 2-A [Phlyctochytrium planicorne]